MTDKIKEEKQYGLVVPSKNRLAQPKPGNIFGEESGSDEDDGTDWVRKALRAEGEKNLVKKQTQLTMKRALKEDPTVYQYDEVYDDIERSKVEEKINKKSVEKKAKYIENLLKAADRRKREQEHRVERMVQKEREAEGAMFADKESFVTSAYRAKLEEFKKMEDEEKRMDRLEAIGDVTKQQDISGFYRHLYSQTVDHDKKEDDKMEMKEEQRDAGDKNENLNEDGDNPQTSSESEKNSEIDNERDLSGAKRSIVKGSVKRQYRKRMAEVSQSSSESESENTRKGEKLDESKDQASQKRIKLSPRGDEERFKKIETKDSSGKEANKSEKMEENKKKTTPTTTTKKKLETNAKTTTKIQSDTPKISIWEKRTVGPVFEAALERYYTRKAARSSG